MDRVAMLIEFEYGGLSAGNVLILFADLLKDGTVWQLQGGYGRFAERLIEAGYLSPNGDILRDADDDL